jgi:Formiminotransferase domain, N-terminal subdomain
MLILPPGHAQQIRAPIRARWMGVVGAVLTVALIAFALIAITTKGHHSGNGCVDVVIPYAVGGQELYHCGAAAKALCRGVDTPQGFSGTAGAAVATECRNAGVPVGPSA